MNAVDQLVQLLSRPTVSEVVLASGKAPLVKLGGEHRPVSAQVLSTVHIAQMLQALGAPSLAAGRPVQWVARTQGAGAVEVTALQRGDVLQVRFTLPRAPEPSAPAPEEGSGLELAWDVRARREAGPPAPAAEEAQEAEPVRAPARPAAGPEGHLDALLSEARGLGASDVHVVAGRPPLYRVAGELSPRGEALPPETVAQLVLPLVPARLQGTLEREGSCDFALERGPLGRFRVNVVRQRTGLKACLRVIPREIPSLASLGLPEAMAKGLDHHQGLVVLSGPSGSGKTSTLAALVDRVNTERAHHVISVEDPVEFIHPRKRAMMSQREVGTHTRTFASALKGSLREDPDVIVIGELRDTETVRIALSAAETGHLVLATMNTPSAAKTIDRLIDLFPPADQAQVRMSLATGLRLIVSQRLVPSEDRTRMHVAAELLPGSVALGNLIREEKTFQIPSLMQRGKALGIVRFDDSLAELVRAGKTTLAIAREYAQAPDELQASLHPAPVPNPAAPAAAGPGSEAARRAVGNVLGRVGSLVGRK